MRKNLSMILILILMIVLVSCSSKETPAPVDNVANDSPQEQKADAPIEQPTTSPVENPTSVKNLSETYQKMMEDGKYTMKYKTSMNTGDSDTEVEITLAVMDNMSAMIMDSDDFESVIINKDKTIYMIDHENRTIMIMPEGSQVSDEEASTSPEDLKDFDLQYLGSGREEFLGKERPYEEYSFEGGSTKYYYDGNDLDGMIIRMGDQTTIMDIEEMSDLVDENLFELPEGYQEIKLGI